MPLRTVLCRARPPKFDTANIGWDVIDNAAMDVGDMKLPQLKAELKARQQVQVGMPPSANPPHCYIVKPLWHQSRDLHGHAVCKADAFRSMLVLSHRHT